MNTYAIIILCALLISYVLETLCGYLNLSALKQAPPPELKNLYPREKYLKSQMYAQERIKLGFWSSSIELICILAFWFTGGFNLLDLSLRQLGWNTLITGMAYIGVLGLLLAILHLPFDLYSTYILEERFGFNKTSLKVFVVDKLKVLALSLILGMPLLALVLWFFQAAGPLAWLYGWVTVTVFMLLIQYMAPQWIMPLFNTFTPLAEGELKTAIFDYAKAVEFPLKEIVIMDGSKRSTKANAFFTGWGKNKRIALYDTMLKDFNVPELVAVIAHEVGHFKLQHITKGVLLSCLTTGGMFYLLSIFMTHAGLFEAFNMQYASNYAGLVFFGLLFTPIQLLLSVGRHLLSRTHEFEADRFAAATTGHSQWLIDALKKLAAKNLSNLTPHPLSVFLYYTHPPLHARIQALSVNCLNYNPSK